MKKFMSSFKHQVVKSYKLWLSSYHQFSVLQYKQHKMSINKQSTMELFFGLSKIGLKPVGVM